MNNHKKIIINIIIFFLALCMVLCLYMLLKTQFTVGVGAIILLAYFSTFELRKKKWTNILDSLGEFTITFIFIVPILMYVLSNLIQSLITAYPEYFQTIGSNSDWFSFFGSLAGGLATMFAVVFTIQNEKNKAREDKISQSMPIISVEPVYNSKPFMKLFKVFNYIYFFVNISNISNNHARYVNTRITEFLIFENDNEYVDIANSLFLFETNSLSILPANQSKNNITLSFISDVVLLEKLFPFIKNKDVQVRIKLRTDLYDIYKLKKWTYETVIVGELPIPEKASEDNVLDSGDLGTIKTIDYGFRVEHCETDFFEM